MNKAFNLEMTGEEIIQHLRSPLPAQRRKAENQLFFQYVYFINEATRKYRLSEDNVLDAFSDSVMAAIDAIVNGRFLEKCSLKTFLYQVFHFKCVDIVRKKSIVKNTVHQTIGFDDMQLNFSDESHTMLEILVKRSEQQLLRTHLKRLCNKSQRLLLLAAEGYTDREIAEALKFKTGQVVKTSRLRCIRKLRALNGYGSRMAS